MACGTLLLVAVAAPAAGGEAPSATAKTGTLPAFASLPEGHIASLPRETPPLRIAATEKVDGFYPTRLSPKLARQMSIRPGVSFTYLFPGQQQARAFARSRANRNDCAVDPCLTDGGIAASLRAAATNDPDADPGDWPQTCSAMLSFQVEPRPNPSRARRGRKPQPSTDGQNVHAVRSERLTLEQDGHAMLSLTDAWVDARTRGARLIGHSTLPLSRVFVGPNGLEVYAARDGNALQVVVRASDHPSDDPALAEQLRARLRAMTVSLPGGNGGNGDCGHVGFTLRSAPGGGQMATLRSTAFLPSLDGDPGGPEGESDDARAERELEALRQRPFQLSVSTTSSTADASPVVSIALGWTGRERTGD
jgi:hypothetical protein